MTILLYKDGKLIVDAEQPLEGVSLDNLAAILSGASDGDVIQYDATNGMWLNKSAPSSLPEVTASDKGKYLKANESTGDPEWASGGSSGGGVLVVNATISGTTITCDTKASVMYAAFEAGTTIIIKRSDGYESVCIGCLHDDEYGYIFDVPFPDNAAYRADTDDDYPVAHVE